MTGLFLLAQLMGRLTGALTLEHLRTVNYWLGALTTGGLLYRLPAAYKNVASKRLLISLAVFPPVVGLGSLVAYARHAPASPIIPVATAAFIALALVLVFWPKQLSD